MYCSWSTTTVVEVEIEKKTLFWKPDEWSVELIGQKVIAVNPFSWTRDSSWHEDKSNVSINKKAQNYDFTDRLRVEHTGAKKSIGLTRLQGFSASLNMESGLVEAKGTLIKNIEKMKFFNGIFILLM